jgi:ATP/maltotriose-dependent transcriptional regulator MalT
VKWKKPKQFRTSKKKHLYNIYQKLNVKGRRQAVEKARALGIL